MIDRPPSVPDAPSPADAPLPGPPPWTPTPTPSSGDAADRLTVGWQIMLAVGWAAVFFAFAATWKASEEIGIGTWWLGPRSERQPLLVSLLPFALALWMALVAIYNVRRAALISLAGAFAVAVIAVFDVPRSGGLAAIEFAIGGAAALISIGALTGSPRQGGSAAAQPLPPPAPAHRADAPLDPPRSPR